MDAEKDKTNPDSDAIMLAQFTETHNDWRYEDGRVEGAVRLYLSTCAILASVTVGVFALYPNVKNPNLFWWLSIVLTPFLFALGTFTTRRVKNSTISRERRMFAINLTKRYFQDKYPGVANYLPVNVKTADPLPAWGDEDKRRAEGDQLTVSFPDGIVYFILVLNSVLCGLFFYSIFALIRTTAVSRLNGREDFLTTLAISIFTALAAYLWQDESYRASKKKFNDRKK